MEKVIERIEKVKVGTTAKDIAADRRDFFLENVSESATVYFKEKSEDGKVCTAENGFALLPKTIFPRPLCAKTLSVIASAADADLRVLYVGEG